MGLNARGYISILQAVAYTPILLLAIFLIIRHGIKKQQGWIFLAIFAQARIIGAILLIAEEAQTNPSTGLITAASIVQSIGLSPLVLTTLGFLCTVGRGTGLFTDKYPVSKVTHLVLAGAVALGVVAGTEATKPEDANQVSAFRKVSAVLFFVTYLFLVGLHVYFWLNREIIRPTRRTLLMAISCATPALFMRYIYTLGSAFESASTTTFNLISGSTVAFVIFSVLPELAVVLVYVFSGVAIPLTEDDELEYKGRLSVGSANASGNSIPRGDEPQSLPAMPVAGIDRRGIRSYSPTYTPTPQSSQSAIASNHYPPAHYN